MEIWKNSLKKVDLEHLNALSKNTIHTALGIHFSMIGENFLEATMPVDDRTQNPLGILHGGASVVLAESLGSVASFIVTEFIPPSQNPSKIVRTCVGLEINASHLNSIQHGGEVIGRVTPIRIGKTIHVWDIAIRGQKKDKIVPVCRSRLSVAILYTS